MPAELTLAGQAAIGSGGSEPDGFLPYCFLWAQVRGPIRPPASVRDPSGHPAGQLEEFPRKPRPVHESPRPPGWLADNRCPPDPRRLAAETRTSCRGHRWAAGRLGRAGGPDRRARPGSWPWRAATASLYKVRRTPACHRTPGPAVASLRIAHFSRRLRGFEGELLASECEAHGECISKPNRQFSRFSTENSCSHRFWACATRCSGCARGWREKSSGVPALAVT